MFVVTHRFSKKKYNRFETKTKNDRFLKQTYKLGGFATPQSRPGLDS